MAKLLVTLAVAAAMVVAIAQVAEAHHHHHGKGCKAEFMYMKGGKCMDSRAKA
jgi:hypothetical protein